MTRVFFNILCSSFLFLKFQITVRTCKSIASVLVQYAIVPLHQRQAYHVKFLLDFIELLYPGILGKIGHSPGRGRHRLRKLGEPSLVPALVSCDFCLMSMSCLSASVLKSIK